LCCNLKEELHNFFYQPLTVSFLIIGCLSPVIWRTHGSEILLAQFFLIFKFIPVSFFLVSPFIFPQPIPKEIPMSMARLRSRTCVHRKVPLRLDRPTYQEYGLVIGLKRLVFRYQANIGTGAPFTSRLA
jgi:hypothetical protein